MLSVQVLVLVLPGQEQAVSLDTEGQQALGILRQLGMPAVMAAVVTGQGGPAHGAPAAVKLKDRAAAKKRAAAVLESQVRAP
jgi:hypothetical protein